MAFDTRGTYGERVSRHRTPILPSMQRKRIELGLFRYRLVLNPACEG